MTKDVEQRGCGFTGRIDVPACRKRGHPAARTTSEREQPIRVLRELFERDARAAACLRISSSECDQRREIRVALARLGEQRQVRDELLVIVWNGDGELRTNDGGQ